MIKKVLLSLFLFFSGFLLSILSLNVFLGEILNLEMFGNFNNFSILSGAIWEEFLFRYLIILILLNKKLSIIQSIVISSSVFSFLHLFNDVNSVAIVGYFIAGIYYSACWLFFDLRKNKNLIFLAYGCGIHTGWNSWQVNYYHDYDFENSVLNIAVRLFILSIAFLLLFLIDRVLQKFNFSTY